MFVTLLGRAFESELGHPDLMSWLPWALVFDISPIVEGILGIVAGRLTGDKPVYCSDCFSQMRQ